MEESYHYTFYTRTLSSLNKWGYSTTEDSTVKQYSHTVSATFSIYTYISIPSIILKSWVGFNQLAADVVILLCCWTLCVVGNQRSNRLHNLSPDRSCDDACAYGINSPFRKGTQWGNLKRDVPLVVSCDSRHWNGSIWCTSLWPEFLIVRKQLMTGTHAKIPPSQKNTLVSPQFCIKLKSVVL